MADVKEKYYASVSFGKDSLAMLLLLIETGQPLNEVVFYDTGMEFQAIYHIRDMVRPILQKAGIIYTELTPPRPFIEDMLSRKKIKRNGEVVYGDGWCGGPCRWGTFIKQNIINKYIGSNRTYLGIASDEVKRLEKLEPHKSSPLAVAGFTESDCLEYCHQHGFYWIEDGVELYSVLDRVSCWCCKNKNLKELRNIYHQLPGYWSRLRYLQQSINAPMKGNGKSVFELERRFNLEDKWLADGKKINTRAFYEAIKE